MAWVNLIKTNQENQVQEVQPQSLTEEKSLTLNQKNILTISTSWKCPKPTIYIPNNMVYPSHRLYNHLLNQSHFSRDQQKVLLSLYKKLILPYSLNNKNYISIEQFFNFAKNYNNLKNYKKIKVNLVEPKGERLPYLTRQEEILVSNIPDTLVKAETIINILDLKKIEDDASNYHVDFDLENKVQNLCLNIQDQCESYGLFNRLNTGQLLAFLHPEYVPLF